MLTLVDSSTRHDGKIACLPATVKVKYKIKHLFRMGTVIVMNSFYEKDQHLPPPPKKILQLGAELMHLRGASVAAGDLH